MLTGILAPREIEIPDGTPTVRPCLVCADLYLKSGLRLKPRFRALLNSVGQDLE